MKKLSGYVRLFHVKHFFGFFFLFFLLRKVLISACTIVCIHRYEDFMQGRCPCNPARGVPPLVPLLRALRGQDSAVKVQNILSGSLSRDQALDDFDFSPFLRVRGSRRKHLTL